MRQPGQVTNLQRVGTNIRNRRLALDLTQEDAAHGAGIHPTHWSRIELGKKEPGVVTLIAVARALSTKPGELLRGVK